MECHMYERMKQLVKRIKEVNGRRIYLYPFGYRALEVYIYLSAISEYEIIRVDETLGRESGSACITFSHMCEMAKWGGDEGDVLVIASDNIQIYNEIRIKVEDKIPEKYVVDLFPRNPLIFCDDRRVASLAIIAEKIYKSKISGSVAEVGVYRGEFAKYINMLFPDRKCYLFDTFEGFSHEQLDMENDSKVQTDQWIDALKNTSEELVLSKLKYKENVQIIKGLFPDTVVRITDNFSFVNLDIDIFSPTYEGLKYFWNNLNPGGVIFVHDFGIWDGIGCAIKRFCSEYHVGYIPICDGATVALTKSV